jgi:hypothetical protein
MADLDKLVEELSKLTVIEAAELSKKLEDSWGVSAAAPVAVAAAAAGDAPAQAEEQDSFDVILASFGEKKINVIRKSAPSRAWVSRRPRTWWKPRLRRSRKALARKRRRSSRLRSRLRAPRSRSSSLPLPSQDEIRTARALASVRRAGFVHGGP